MQPFQEHPGEGGQIEVVQHPSDDRAQHLEGRQELRMWSVPDHVLSTQHFLDIGLHFQF